MMAITHAALAAAAVPLILGNSDPLILGLAITGSQLPDIDTSTSLIGQFFYPISRAIEEKFPHRSASHSFLAVAVVAAAWWFICRLIGFSNIQWLALWLGMFVSIVADTFTIKGVQLFWPHPVWCYSGSSWDRRRLKTGGTGEMWVLLMSVVIACWVAFGGFLGAPGGIAGSVGQSIGIRDSIMSAYNASANTHHVFADVQGTFASDRSSASGRYWIISAEGTDFYLFKDDKIFKTGTNLIADRTNIIKGEPAKTEIIPINLDDEPVLEKLKNIAQSYQNSSIFITGSLEIDFPEDIKQSQSPQEFQTLTLTGNTANLKLLPIEKAISLLIDQYGIGNLELRIITPKPIT
jgi:inner membrane protein